MKKTSLLAAVGALVMLLSVSLGSTLAYFTAWTNGDTELTISFSAETELHEDIDPDTLTKTVTVTNVSENDVAVRVSVMYDYIDPDYSGGDGWTYDDGYYYYDSILKPTETTSAITIVPDLEAAAEDGASFSIVVNSEAIQVVEEDGMLMANWPDVPEAEEVN